VKPDRISGAQAGYMELKGAVKDGDCHKVAVPGGISKRRGCCNEFKPKCAETDEFRCGECHFVEIKGFGGRLAKS
jgi:hypothetical protein